jgi:hypothetical protein
MKRMLPFLVLPLIGLALATVSLLLNSTQLRLRFGGDRVRGEVAGMLIARMDGVDLVSRFDSQITLTLADGTVVQGHFRNRKPVAPLPSLAPEHERILLESVEGDAASLRWALKREGRREGAATRVVRIEKTETVQGILGMPSVPKALVLRDGMIQPRDLAAVPPIGTVVTRAVFDTRDADSLKSAKGDSMLEYEQIRGGARVQPAKRDFLLFCEPYASEFRPVFRYEVGGISYPGLSHIGRHGGPTLALRLFRPCLVFFDPERPSEALLVADPGSPEGAWLAWFSRYCEGVFAQWGSGSLIALAGGIFFLVGLGFVSLVLWPSNRLVTR